MSAKEGECFAGKVNALTIGEKFLLSPIGWSKVGDGGRETAGTFNIQHPTSNHPPVRALVECSVLNVGR